MTMTTDTSTLAGEPQVVPPTGYHLLLAHGGTQVEFSELVASSVRFEAFGAWFATVENAFETSSVEADARLARWSKKTGGVALRVSRPDDVHVWLAAHLDGQRLPVISHYVGPTERLELATVAGMAVPDAVIGRDPLLDLVREHGTTMNEARREVARRRAEMLEAALAAGGVVVDHEALLEAFFQGTRAELDAGIPELLAVLGVSEARSLLRAHQGDRGALPAEVAGALKRDLVLGLVVPVALAGLAFVFSARIFARAGPMVGLIGGGLIAAFTASIVRAVMRRFIGRGPQVPNRFLDWAGDARLTGAIQPTAQALDTWGGLFYLLRDIAFFAGIDRPRGAYALYVEGTAMGPPRLVDAMNRVTAGAAPSGPLHQAGEALVALRERLVTSHLEKTAVEKDRIVSEVRQILSPVVSGP